MNSILDEIVTKHALVAAVAIDANGKLFATSTNFDQWDKPKLVPVLIEPFNDSENTFKYLEGKTLPQMFSHGNYYAFMDVPSPGIAVIVFGEGDMNVKKQFIMSKKISDTIRQQQWKTTTSHQPAPSWTESL